MCNNNTLPFVTPCSHTFKTCQPKRLCAKKIVAVIARKLAGKGALYAGAGYAGAPNSG